MRIGEVARRTGLTVHALRFYEREGLLPAAGRAPSNYREFSPTVVDQIAFIREAQALGFTIAELRAMLAPRRGPIGCADLRGIAERKIADIDAEMGRLRDSRTALVNLLRGCDGAAARAEPCSVTIDVRRARRD